jgi:thymidine phosphorylase
VEFGAPLFVIHANSEASLEEARENLSQAVEIGDKAVEPLPLFYDVVR